MSGCTSIDRSTDQTNNRPNKQTNKKTISHSIIQSIKQASKIKPANQPTARSFSPLADAVARGVDDVAQTRCRQAVV